MILWAAEKEVKKQNVAGLCVWFVEIVMSNTSSQEARDLMPGIEVIHSETSRPYFKAMGGETKALCCLSDNALISAAHTPFVNALNQSALVPSIDESSEDQDDDDDSGNTSDGNSSNNSDDSNDNDSNNSSDDNSGHNSSTDDSSNEGDDSNNEGDNSSNDSASNDSDNSAANKDIAVQIKSIDAFFIDKARKRFKGSIANWQSTVEPWIYKWITWEAQCCKTELDTHFAYLNKQLTEACLHGGIDYLDPWTVFDALCYKSGSKAMTTLLMAEIFDEAQGTFDACNSVLTKKDQGGINSVHDQTWLPDGIELAHYVFEYQGEREEFQARYEVADELPRTGKILKNSVSNTEPICSPFTEDLLDDDNEQMKELNMDRLPG
jgi:hypothetical protein